MTSNPYSNLGDHHFWRRAVSEVERFQFDPVVTTRFTIDTQDRVATAGSCFAQHISNRLSRIGFNYQLVESGEDLPPDRRHALNYGVFSARYGNIYTSRQLLQLFQECMGQRAVHKDVWQRDDGRYVDALRPQIDPDGFATPEEVRRQRGEHLAAVRTLFETCDVFVFTLGLTETWRSRNDGTVYPLAPGVSGGRYDAERHEFLNLNIHQVLADMQSFMNGLKSVNSNARMVLTVSPVPLIATYEDCNVLVATTYSKSVLRVAADILYRDNPWVEYFPSYEIITGNFSHGMYYEDDLRGINTLGVDHAMRCFIEHYTSDRGAHAHGPKAPIPQELDDIVCDEEAIDQVRI